jgi:6-phosphogluconolactonase
MDIQIYTTQEDLNQSFTTWFKEIVTEKETVTVALSGGATPRSLFDYWARLPEGEIDWKKIKFFWGDERCVPPTDNDSNYKMTKDHLFNFLPIPQENIFRILGENDPEVEAKRYSELLDNELETKKGVPSFDILMLGMGDDGHTASIFTHEISRWDHPDNCVTATHPVTGQIRVSLTGKVINAAQQVVFLVTGENKADKVAEIIGQPQEAAKKYPAALVQPDSDKLLWFLDQKAAQKLR